METQGYPGTPVAFAQSDARLEFIRKTYAHLGGAVLAFAALEALLFKTGVAVELTSAMLSSRGGMIVAMIAFMVVGSFANRWAQSARSVPMQYVGLALYVLAEVLIFCPLLFVAEYYSKQPNLIRDAGVITAVMFGSLTGIVFLTKKDFTFMKGALSVAGIAMLAIAVGSMIFGFNLGMLYCGAAVALAAGYILYYTSNVLRHYPPGAHVAAALALFSALALMFWYVLRILMDRRS